MCISDENAKVAGEYARNWDSFGGVSGGVACMHISAVENYGKSHYKLDATLYIIHFHMSARELRIVCKLWLDGNLEWFGSFGLFVLWFAVSFFHLLLPFFHVILAMAFFNCDYDIWRCRCRCRWHRHKIWANVFICLCSVRAQETHHNPHY